MDAEDLAREFLVFLKAGEPKSKHTVTTMNDTFRRLRRDHAFDPVRFASGPEAAILEGRRVLASLRSRESPNPYNAAQRVLNAYARFLRMENVHFRKLPEIIPPPSSLNPDEISRIIAYRAPGESKKALEQTARRRCLAWVSLYTALRRGEIHRLRVSDFDFTNRTFLLRRPSKRGPPRVISVEAEFFSPHRPLSAWIHKRPIPKTAPDALWTTSFSKLGPRPLTYNQVGLEFNKISQATGVRFYATRGRHTNATLLLRATGNLALVQYKLGHASIRTTSRYAETGAQDLANAVRKTPIPSFITPKKPEPEKEPETNDEQEQ